MEKIGLPRFVPSQMEVRYDVELPAAKVGGHGHGVTGPQGPQGPQGEKGEHGHLGPQGHTGAQGADGQNAAGWKMKGYKDSIDELPAIGENGDCWYIGQDMFIYIGLGQGRTDTPGDAYISTPAAQRGDRGYQGVQGERGYQGDRGYQGVKGPQGDKGERGHQGLQGYQGLQGPQGYQGSMGPIGPEGQRGIPGEMGLRGYQGYQGDSGTSINIVGYVDSIDLLPFPANLGDAYGIVNDEMLYYFVGENKGWTSTPHDSYRGFKIDIYGLTGPQGAEGPQGQPGIDGQAFDFDIKTSEEIVVNIGEGEYVGGYRHGDIIPAGTTLKGVLKKLFTRVPTPIYYPPTLVPDPEMIYVYSPGQSRDILANFTQNDAGPLTKWEIYREGELIATGNTDRIEFSDDDEMAQDLQYLVKCEYAEGPIKYDSLGYEVPGHILAGSIEIQLNFTCEMTNNFFYILSEDNIVASELVSIDQYTEYGSQIIEGQTVSVDIPEGTKCVAFLVPSDLPIKKIIDTNWNVNVLSSYEMSDKQYEYGGNLNNYKLYLYNALAGLDAVTYRITV